MSFEKNFKPRIKLNHNIYTVFRSTTKMFFFYVELTEKKLLNVTPIFRLWYVGSCCGIEKITSPTKSRLALPI